MRPWSDDTPDPKWFPTALGPDPRSPDHRIISKTPSFLHPPFPDNGWTSIFCFYIFMAAENPPNMAWLIFPGVTQSPAVEKGIPRSLTCSSISRTGADPKDRMTVSNRSDPVFPPVSNSTCPDLMETTRVWVRTL